MAEKLSKLLLHALIIMVILWVVRLVFIVEYVPFDLLTGNRQALPLAAYNVFRFDFQVASYLLILPTLLVFAVLLWRNQGFEHFLRRFSVWYFVVLDVLILIISIIDLAFMPTSIRISTSQSSTFSTKDPSVFCKPFGKNTTVCFISSCFAWPPSS